MNQLGRCALHRITARNDHWSVPIIANKDQARVEILPWNLNFGHRHEWAHGREQLVPRFLAIEFGPYRPMGKEQVETRSRSELDRGNRGRERGSAWLAKWFRARCLSRTDGFQRAHGLARMDQIKLCAKFIHPKRHRPYNLSTLTVRDPA